MSYDAEDAGWKPFRGQMCFYCGTKPATHKCTGCGHWICDSAVCAARAGAQALLNKTKSLFSKT